MNEPRLNFLNGLNGLNDLNHSTPHPSTLPQTSYPRQDLGGDSRLQRLEPLIDFRAHRVFAFFSAIVGEALEARLPKRSTYNNRGEIESFNRIRDLLPAQPPRAGGDYGPADETDQESHGPGGVQQSRDDRYAEVFAEPTADGGKGKRDRGSDRQTDRSGKLLRDAHIRVFAVSYFHPAEHRLRFFENDEVRPQTFQDLTDALGKGTLKLGEASFSDIRLDLRNKSFRQRAYLGLEL